MRAFVLATLAIVLTGCSAAPSQTAVAVRPAPTAVPAPTAAPPAPTTGPNYGKYRQDLLLPLGALIVATRNKSELTSKHLADFNAVADQVLPAIAGDMSVNANKLHSVITNVRDAAARKDLETLERERASLIGVR